MAFPTQRFLCHPISANPRPPPYSLPPRKCCPCGLPSPYEYGDLKPILPFLEDRSDAACRVVVKRMRKERFNHALPVLAVVRFFFAGEACGAFFAPGGRLRAGGLLGVGLCARLPRRPCAGISAGRGVAHRRQKPCVVARGELSFPPFFGDPKKGGAGAAGRAAPEAQARDSLRYALRSR